MTATDMPDKFCAWGEERGVRMKSIDRLRKYGARFNNSHDAWSGIGCEILEFADAIDREVDDMWHALTIDAKPMTDENMAESGWVRLPVDADGVPIHAGDVMEERSGNTFEAKALLCFGTHNWLVLSDPRNFSTFRECYDVRHHAPTVEDVLEQFLTAFDDADEGQLGITTRDVIAEYAAKLRLAEGEDA